MCWDYRHESPRWARQTAKAEDKGSKENDGEEGKKKDWVSPRREGSLLDLPSSLLLNMLPTAARQKLCCTKRPVCLAH